MATSQPTESPDSISDLLYARTAESKFGGYKLSLLTDPLPSLACNFLLCSKCKSLLRKACSDSVQGQFICEECSATENLTPAIQSRTTISELKVICPLTPRGCVWSGLLAGIEEHLTSCLFYKIQCTNGCGKIIMRLGMEQHILAVCLMGEIECEYCNAKVRMKLMNEHLVCCEEMLVNCCHLCGLGICRRLMDIHIKEHCPESLVICKYSKYGCGVEVKRKEIEVHLGENRFQHLEMQILGLESTVLVQDMIIGDMQVRENDKDGIIYDLKMFKDQLLRRIVVLESNSKITPAFVEINIPNLLDSFENTRYRVTRDTCSAITFGYYEIVYSYSFLTVDMMSLFIEVQKGERDSELEWPLIASCKICIIPFEIAGCDHEYPPVKIVQNIVYTQTDDISLIASIDKATATNPTYFNGDFIRVRIGLESEAPLLRRK